VPGRACSLQAAIALVSFFTWPGAKDKFNFQISPSTRLCCGNKIKDEFAFYRWIYGIATVIGVPSRVKRFSTAARTCNSAT
jgi:hypothetical protein